LKNSGYESARLLSEYLLFHYGAPREILPYDFGPRDALDFPRRCVTECLDASRRPARALDVGCAVGRATFELARHCEEAVGVDFSRGFIKAARTLQSAGELSYERVDEGALTTRCTAAAPAGIDRARVRFETGDAMNLPEDLGVFDVVLAANLICRLSDPARFLLAAPRLVKPGGQLILTSPHTWLEEFTPRANWLGGSRLQGLLEAGFTLERRFDMPFLIREHRRKFQWSVAEATLWTRLIS